MKFYNTESWFFAAISDLSPKRIPVRTLKRGFISEFLDMARTVQPQGFAPQDIDDMGELDYMDIVSKLRRTKWIFIPIVRKTSRKEFGWS